MATPLKDTCVTIRHQSLVPTRASPHDTQEEQARELQRLAVGEGEEDALSTTQHDASRENAPSAPSLNARKSTPRKSHSHYGARTCHDDQERKSRQRPSEQMVHRRFQVVQ